MAETGRFSKLYIDDGHGNWLLFAGVREKSKSHSVDSVDNSGDDPDGYQSRLPSGRRAVSLSVSGVAKGGQAMERVLDHIDNATLATCKFEGYEDVLEGDFHIGSWEESAPYQDAITFSASFQSANAFTWYRPITLVSEDEWINDVLTFERDSKADYTDSDGVTQTADADEPRFDYANDGTFLGLLVEGRDIPTERAMEILSGAINGTLHTDGFSVEITAKIGDVDHDQVLWQVDDDSEDNRIRVIRQADRELRYQASVSGSTVVNLLLDDEMPDTQQTDLELTAGDPLELTAGDTLVITILDGEAKPEFTLRLRAAANDYAASLDGGAVVQDKNAAMPSLTHRRIGGASSGNDNDTRKPWGGWIKEVRELQRPMTDNELRG